jgi:calcium-dependent protein kinase
LSQPPNWKRIDHCSSEAKQLCRDMLTFDESKRPSAQECLSYSWFREAQHLKDAIFTPEMMADLVKYHERTDLEKMVRMQVASQLSATKLPKLNLIFQKYDTNNNGTLGMDELALALEELGVDPATCARAAEALDVDQSGEVEYTEFVAGCLNFFDDNLDTMLWQAFCKFDHDRSGKLSVDEVSQLLSKGTELGLGTLAPDQSQVKAMIAKLDKNSDGEVDFDEFRRFFTPKLEG